LIFIIDTTIIHFNFIYLSVVGAPISSTNGPGPYVVTDPERGLPTFAVIIVAIVVACIIVALTAILIVCIVSSCRRRITRKRKEEQSALNDMSRIAQQMRERDTKKTADPVRSKNVKTKRDQGYGSKRVKIVAEEMGSEKKRAEKKDSLRAKTLEKKKKKKKSLSRATSSGTDKG